MFIFLLLVLYKILNNRVRDLGPLGRFIVALYIIVYYCSQKSLEEGYAAIYHKMKSKDPSEHPWYKVYKLSDYKKMQREVRLNRGTLGPDLDTEPYKEKVRNHNSETLKQQTTNVIAAK